MAPVVTIINQHQVPKPDLFADFEGAFLYSVTGSVFQAHLWEGKVSAHTAGEVQRQFEMFADGACKLHRLVISPALSIFSGAVALA